jgi:hypothetical protein
MEFRRRQPVRDDASGAIEHENPSMAEGPSDPINTFFGFRCELSAGIAPAVSMLRNPDVEDTISDPGRCAGRRLAVPDDESWAPAEPDGLSTDYLNHYSEILMLIEMAVSDEAVVNEIGSWRPVGYCDYFLRSPLRRAPAAIAAYRRLRPERRNVFERIAQALDKLTLGAIFALQPPCHSENVALIVDVIGPAIRRLIDQAAAFLNSGGTAPCEGCGGIEEPQRIIDRLIMPLS